METLTYSNGVTHTWTYDVRNRLKDLSIRNSSFSILNSFAYSLNPAGHRSQVVEESGRTVGYSYDNNYRLTQETISGDSNPVLNGTTDWEYDLVGNRLSQNSSVDSVLSVVESYSANNWLDRHTYDSNGNTTSSEAFGEGGQQATVTLNDSYDWRNRLIRREKSDGTVIEIIYDGHGDRIKKTVTPFGAMLGEITWFLVDRNNLTGYAQVVEEIEQGGAVQVVYAYGLDLISQDRRQSDDSWQQSYYLYDGLGSVRGLADSTGTVTDEYTYDAWGVLLEATTNQQQATTNAYRFTGEQWDADLEMVFLRARYLDTSTGRFHTMDTFEGVATDPVTLHKYLYANGNPATYVDPSGNVSISSIGAALFTHKLLLSMASASSAFLLSSAIQARVVSIAAPLSRELDSLAFELSFFDPEAASRISGLSSEIKAKISVGRLVRNIAMPTFLAALPPPFNSTGFVWAGLQGYDLVAMLFALNAAAFSEINFSKNGMNVQAKADLHTSLSFAKTVFSIRSPARDIGLADDALRSLREGRYDSARSQFAEVVSNLSHYGSASATITVTGANGSGNVNGSVSGGNVSISGSGGFSL